MKRKAEIDALELARRALPKELVSNPLLLSLIAILFRSGCTLPDSKLEMYRSCVGTLTEKWDAAGKKLDMPAEYNLVRDKKGAFARIAYWMYKESSAGPDAQGRLKYGAIVAELARHLCEREFKGREPEAEKAAECFLDYAAKRSIFVEGRFVHKTFHEYFAALYLYRSFCVGHTADELYSEIHPHLDSDYWTVVLELLFQMIDEASGELLDFILAKVISEVAHSPSGRSALLPLPLRMLAELQNVGTNIAESLVALSVSACVSVTVPELWIDERSARRAHVFSSPEEAPHHMVASVLAELPIKFRPLRIKYAIQAAAKAGDNIEKLLRIAALCVEKVPAFGRPEEVIPNWSSVCNDLAQRHLGIFFYVYTPGGALQQIDRFVELIGEDRLFHSCRFVFDSSAYASPMGCVFYNLKSETKKEALESSIEQLLGNASVERILDGVLQVSDFASYMVDEQPEIAMNHFLQTWENPRKYLVDWFLLSRRGYQHSIGPTRRAFFKSKLSRVAKSGTKAQRFYSALLLNTNPPAITEDDLGVPNGAYNALLQLARSTPRPRLRSVSM